MCRSFGDAYLKYKEFNGPPYEDGDRSRGRHVPEPYTPPYITHVPEIISRDLSKQDDFVIAATDGLWDFLENKEAVDIVAKCVREGKPQEASQRLVEAALSKAAAESHMTVEVYCRSSCRLALRPFIHLTRLLSLLPALSATGAACSSSRPGAACRARRHHRCGHVLVIACPLGFLFEPVRSFLLGSS